MSGALDVAKGAFKASRQVINNPGIAQDNVIFAMILFAFIVWITTKGELPKYISFFKPGAATGPATDPVTASSTTGATTPSSVVNNTVTGINNAVNGTAIGSAITALTGTAPLTLSATPGGIFQRFTSWLTGGTNAAPK
jgi:hypothetical protein